MALSISNDEADRLARELAAATGESLADAVTNALRERLERHRLPTGDERIARAMQIAHETAALLGGRSVDSKALFDDLYDDDGAPR